MEQAGTVTGSDTHIAIPLLLFLFLFCRDFCNILLLLLNCKLIPAFSGKVHSGGVLKNFSGAKNAFPDLRKDISSGGIRNHGQDSW